MDPSPWQWKTLTPPDIREAVACVLWDLADNGPAVPDVGGQAAWVLRKRLADGPGPYVVGKRQRAVSEVLDNIRRTYPHTLKKTHDPDNAKLVTSIALAIPVEELPPRPGTPAPEPTQLALGDRPPGVKPEPKPRGRPPGTRSKDRPERAAAITPTDALHAIRQLVSASLGADETPELAQVADRLSEALRDNDELRKRVDALDRLLLDERAEIDVLRRALAATNGQARR